jgi:hypothetical protein
MRLWMRVCDGCREGGRGREGGTALICAMLGWYKMHDVFSEMSSVCLW